MPVLSDVFVIFCSSVIVLSHGNFFLDFATISFSRLCRLHMNYRFYQIILQVKHFYTNRERCDMLTGYLSLRRQPDGY